MATICMPTGNAKRYLLIWQQIIKPNDYIQTKINIYCKPNKHSKKGNILMEIYGPDHGIEFVIGELMTYISVIMVMLG